MNKQIRNIILNADDLGFSPGVNIAIKNAYQKGYLTHASLMANTDFFQDAIENVVNFCPELKIGTHINLTCGKALNSENPLAKANILRNSFIFILFKYKTKSVLKEIEKEIELQILKIKNCGIEISHLDGHEHIHIIPSINKIVNRLAKKHEIPRIREINEDLNFSNIKKSNFVNIGKLILLKTLSLFNQRIRSVKFYSILHTCQIQSSLLFEYLEKNNHAKNIEIMLHPSISELDTEIKNVDTRFVQFLKSKYRKHEYEICFDKRFENYF